jgi:hypothetical protein
MVLPAARVEMALLVTRATDRASNSVNAMAIFLLMRDIEYLSFEQKYQADTPNLYSHCLSDSGCKHIE